MHTHSIILYRRLNINTEWRSCFTELACGQNEELIVSNRRKYICLDDSAVQHSLENAVQTKYYENVENPEVVDDIIRVLGMPQINT